jgi:hypothetical protein
VVYAVDGSCGAYNTDGDAAIERARYSGPPKEFGREGSSRSSEQMPTRYAGHRQSEAGKIYIWDIHDPALKGGRPLRVTYEGVWGSVPARYTVNVAPERFSDGGSPSEFGTLLSYEGVVHIQRAGSLPRVSIRVEGYVYTALGEGIFWGFR